ncbi:MAG TPA: hypothetical protein VME92_00610 [Acetobacteraceae bacterium]|nr:hypothetical protein [Acetobacteraceae bacterium]
MPRTPRRIAAALCVLFGLPPVAACLIASAQAQNASDVTAEAAFAAALPRFRQAAPDEVLDLLRQDITRLLTPLPQFDPGSRLVDDLVEQPWPALRRRCAEAAAPLDARGALALATGVLRDGGIVGATEADRGRLAALLASLDGRLCRCTDRPSLALAADCAS